MLVPAKTKYRKAQKGGKKILGTSKGGNDIAFGMFALKALEPGKINSRQIESSRKVITRFMKRSGKLWVRIFPHIPVTKKPAEVRMGSGKGNVEYYVSKVKPGRIIFEIDGVTDKIAIEALNKATAKLPIKAKVIKFI
ncbi:50S ribosomal protein L16 [Rickettsiales bacterium]|jgi:large subunit ribosomal protein L16|nr:50S ribosomal protein L16 [Rickettsiales bacterium]|tara:strand:+ start:4083 stop:4496 length:414 start_codon:yes stop_codon:yes gene_type:complete